ncbi:hypothetical protein V5N11_010039 [Cardamine amara subsp. amara]|uniref:CCHC-type domain-containing protein n=1 Tax=Cardamine amara subsp. amara TaxID=228776 RepID=A0ABD1C9Q3_CARAN
MPGTGGDEEASNTQNNKLLLEALTAEMRRMMVAGMETLREEFRHNTNQEQRRAEPRRDQERSPERERDPRRQPRDEAADANYYSHHSGSSHRSQRRQRRFREDGGHQQDNCNGLKLRIPPFHGKNDPDTYLEWEKKIELVFNCQHYTEANRVKVAATGFYDYALSWWDQLVTSRRRNGEYLVETWREMKDIMRKRYVPSHYHRELLRRQRVNDDHSSSRGGHFSHCSYLDCGVNMEQEKKRRVQQKHPREGDFKVEIQEIEEMLHKALLFEQQVKRNNSSRSSYGSEAVTTQPSYSKEEKNKGENKPAATPTYEEPIAIENKNKAKEVTTRVRDVKCFNCKGLGHYANECANKKTVTNPDNGDIISEEEEVDSNLSTEHLDLPAKGELLEIQDDSHLVPMVEEVQQEQIIQSECIIQEDVSKDIEASFPVENGDDEAFAQPRRYTLSPTPDPYILDFKLLEEVDYGDKKLLTDPYDCEFQDAMGSRHMWLYNCWKLRNPGSDMRLLYNPTKSEEVDFIFGDSAFEKPEKCVKVLILEFLKSNAREEFPDFEKMSDEYFLDFGYNGMKRADELKTTFKKRSELFEWLVMIFGFSNTPSNFKRWKNPKLHNFAGNFCGSLH